VGDQVLVKVRAAGMCGSDLHYHSHGRCGDFIPSRPFILGHEFAGEIVDVGESKNNNLLGNRVAIDPSRPCGHCRLCRQGRYNLCPDMVYFGSASVTPPSDGCFAEYVLVPRKNCIPIPDSFEFAWGALLEPLSVATHAIMRSGGVSGKSVFITGGGTIGQMILIVAKAFGAGKVVITDIDEFPREFAKNYGVTDALDPTTKDFNARALSHSPDGFEVVFEASGVAPALNQAFDMTAKGATVVQVGTLDNGIPIPVNSLLTKEIQYIGSWRFANVFDRVIDLINSGAIDVRALISQKFPFIELPAAIEKAQASEAIKIQIEM
jgi:L-idonate 5-dehydrogenase